MSSRSPESEAHRAAIALHGRRAARDILEGRTAPEAACQTLYRICVALDYPGELQVRDQLDSAWINISVGNHPYTHEAATTATFAEHCKREARALLEDPGER